MWYQWQYSLMGSEILFVVGAVVITALVAVGIVKAAGIGEDRRGREHKEAERQENVQLGRERDREVRHPHRPGWLHPHAEPHRPARTRKVSHTVR